MDIEDLEKQKIKYTKLRSNIVSIINYLKSFKVSVDDVKTKTDNKYTINLDNTPVYTRITKLSKKSGDIRTYLVNTIIPAIDVAIKKCNVQISKLEAEADAKKAAAAKQAAAARTKAALNNSTSDKYDALY